MDELNTYPTHCCHGIPIREPGAEHSEPPCDACRSADLASPRERTPEEAREALKRLQAEVKCVHELLDSNDLARGGLAGENLRHRVSDVVVELAIARSDAGRFHGQADGAGKLLVDARIGRDEANGQIAKLAKFIMERVPGEPSQNEGAVDCAIRIIETLAAQNAAIKSKRDELGKSLNGAEALRDHYKSVVSAYRSGLIHIRTRGHHAASCRVAPELNEGEAPSCDPACPTATAERALAETT